MSDDVLASTTCSYDAIVDSYQATVATPAAGRTEFLQQFIAAVADGGLVLDVGCGPGTDLIEFAAAGLRSIGLDASHAMAARARERGGAALVADLRQPPVRPGSVDAVWSSASLLHVPRQDVARTLNAWRGVLPDGGVLGLITSIGEDEGWEAVPYKASTQHGDTTLRRWFVHHQPAALLDDLHQAGFTPFVCTTRTGTRDWLQVLAR